MTAESADQMTANPTRNNATPGKPTIARAPRKTLTDAAATSSCDRGGHQHRQEQRRDEDQEEVASAARVEHEADEQSRDDECQRTEGADLAVSISPFGPERLERPGIERRRDP